MTVSYNLVYHLTTTSKTLPCRESALDKLGFLLSLSNFCFKTLGRFGNMTGPLDDDEKAHGVARAVVM